MPSVQALVAEVARLEARIEDLERDPFGANLQTIAKQISDCIMVVDRDGQIRYINWTVPDLTPEGVIGTSAYDYVPEPYRAATIRCHRRVLETGEPGEYPVEYFADDGTVSSWHARVSPLREGGDIVGLIIVSINVTERNEAATDRDRFFQLSVDMLCVATLGGQLKRVNPAFSDVLGWSAEELQSATLANFVHPDDRASMLAALARLGGGESAIDFEHRFRCKAGQFVVLQWRAIAQPRLGMLYAVARDVTQQRERENQILHAQKMEAVGTLAGGVAHDFNNLIQAISTNASLALRTVGGPREIESLKAIGYAAQRAAELTHQLLAFSREQPFHPRSIDLNAVIDRMSSMLSRTMPAKVVLVVTPDPSIPAISGDAGQIEQVLLNLCLNARDAMPDGGALTVTTASAILDEQACAGHPGAQPGWFVRLSVADVGIGINEAVRPHIFEPFFTTKEPGAGSGLGLASVYGIVRRHRGFIRVGSSEKGGTQFDVFLPITKEQATPRDEVIEVPVPGGIETILVAEDEPMVRRAVSLVLEEAGYRVVCARDGDEALEKLDEAHGEIALALLDVMMPRRTGPQAAVVIRRKYPCVRIVFTSAYSDARTLGPDVLDEGILSKPYDTAVLLIRIRRELDRPASAARVADPAD